MHVTTLRRMILGFLVVGCACLIGPAGLFGQGVPQPVLSAMVCVRAGNNWGTGCVVDGKRRLILTSHHLTGDAATALMAFPAYRNGRLLTSTYDYGRSFDLLGKVVDADPEHDLALVQLLSLEKDAPLLRLADKSPAAKERLQAVGNPGASGTLWVQAATSVRQQLPRRWQWHAGKGLFDHRASLWETDTPLNTLGAGAPLVNGRGELVGMLSWSLAWNDQGEPAHAISYAIDVQDIKAFLGPIARILEPQNAADYALRGEHHLRRQLYEAAIDDFTTAIRLDPKQAAFYRQRGQAYLEKGDLNPTLGDLDKARSLDANDAVTYVIRGRVYGRKGLLDEAVSEFNKAVERNAKDARACYNRGWAYDRKGDKTRALQDYDRALTLDPADADALIHRGDLHREQHQIGQAVRDYREALRSHPTPFAFTRLASIALEQGNREEALRICTTAIERFDPEDPGAYVLRGRMLAAQGQRDQAIADYSQALTLDPRQVAAYRLRATAYEQKGDTIRSRADAERANQLEKLMESPIRSLSRRYLQIVNETDEPIRVHLQYETLTVMGTWYWYPAPPGSDQFLTWDIRPKQTTYLFDDEFKVKARRMRIWAEGQTSGRRWTQDRDRDVWLCSTEYVGKVEEDYVYRVGK